MAHSQESLPCSLFSCHYIHIFFVFCSRPGVASCGLSLAAEKDEPRPRSRKCASAARPPFLPMADAQRMLEGVGQESRLSPGDRGKVRLKGLFRIRDWTPEQVVRFALTETDNQPASPRLGRGQRRFATLCLPRAPPTASPSSPAKPCGGRIPHLFLASVVTTDDRRGMRLPPVNCRSGPLPGAGPSWSPRATCG